MPTKQSAGQVRINSPINSECRRAAGHVGIQGSGRLTHYLPWPRGLRPAASRTAHHTRCGVASETCPLRNVDTALTEIAYAANVLDADGCGLPTNAREFCLTDDRFLPLLAELDRRKPS